jgi:hypothetical protein
MDTGTISAAIANRILNWLLRKREMQATRDPATGRYLLSCGAAYRGVLIVCALLFLGFLALGIALRDEPVSWAVYSAVFLLPTLGTLYCIHEVLMVRISFSEDGIQREGGLAPSVTLLWSSLTGVDYSNAWSWFSFRGQDGHKIHVSVYMNGLATLAEFASRRMASGPAGGAPPLLLEKALNPDGTRRAA